MDVCGTRYLWIPQEQYINVVSLTINGEVCTDVMVCVALFEWVVSTSTCEDLPRSWNHHPRHSRRSYAARATRSSYHRYHAPTVRAEYRLNLVDLLFMDKADGSFLFFFRTELVLYSFPDCI